MGLLLCASVAWAQPAEFVSASPPLRAVLPAGYTLRPRPDDASAAVLETWQRTRPAGPVVMQFVRVGGELPQRALTADERAALRVSDPFPFTDRVTHRRALGFAVEALHGTATQAGHGIVRDAVALPTVGDTLVLTVVAPTAEAAQASRDLDAVLASARGPRAWRTGPERVAAWVRVGAGLPATGLMVLYLLWRLGRRALRRAGREPWVFAAAVGALWALCGVAFVLPWSSAMAMPAAQALALAGVFVWRARTLRRQGAAP